MTTQLNNSERLIVNQLIDNGLFTSNPFKPTKEVLNAVKTLRQTRNQQRVNNYIKDLLGILPENIQENLLLIFGKEFESPENVHVLLATLKTIINLPELQSNPNDRSVLTQVVIRQVNSEVVDLDEKEIGSIITEIFVDRFKLFTVDHPELSQSESNQEIVEYWHISPDFNTVAQAIINHLTVNSYNKEDISIQQKINQQLLAEKYINSHRSPQLWLYLREHKDDIAEQWASLDRFDLEVGDGYALLLDKKRKQVKSRTGVVAIAVARSMHTGFSLDDLTNSIKNQTTKLFPETYISPSEIKNALIDFGLISIRNGYVYPTPLIQRFAIEEQSKGNNHE